MSGASFHFASSAAAPQTPPQLANPMLPAWTCQSPRIKTAFGCAMTKVRCPPTRSDGVLLFVTTSLALEGGHRLARIDHDRRRLTAATALPHNFRGKLLDRLVGRSHRLLSLGSEFCLAERGP